MTNSNTSSRFREMQFEKKVKKILTLNISEIYERISFQRISFNSSALSFLKHYLLMPYIFQTLQKLRFQIKIKQKIL